MGPAIDLEEIRKAAIRSLPLTFHLTSLPHESRALLDRILEVYLVELGLDRIHDPLSYCLTELIGNAQKAHIKRLYFEENGLNIRDGAEYDRGMARFRGESADRLEHWAEQLKQRGMTISVTFHAVGANLSIQVRNSVELTAQEQVRIYDRIARARAFQSFVEALAQPLDSSEGAGLGIMILLQFLRRIGLGEEALSIEARDGGTVASLLIPLDQVQLEKINVLTEAIARDVDSLPHFPEVIVELIQVTEDPRATLAQISGRIAMDPALTAGILKLVNSAHYVLPRKVTRIPEAVKIVGMKGLRNLLYAYAVQKIIGEKYEEMKGLWEHSYRAAYYAFLLARSFKPSADPDDVYVAGMLHDLGQIIVTYLHPQAMEQMARFCHEKDIPPRILERFSFGLNHADVGALIARKWNFPEQLVEGIRCHHEPLTAPQQHKDVAFCVYLANGFCDLERGYRSFEQLERPVLLEFGIRSEEHCRAVIDRLQKAFDRRTSGALEEATASEA